MYTGGILDYFPLPENAVFICSQTPGRRQEEVSVRIYNFDLRVGGLRVYLTYKEKFIFGRCLRLKLDSIHTE